MKLTYDWLKDFTEIKLPPRKLAEKLAMAGLEVKAIEEKEGDFVFEIEITSNRPDWLSVIGVAREVAAVTGRKLKALQAASCKLQAKKSLRPEACGLKPFFVQVEEKEDCPLYTATIIGDVKIAPSPEWMQKRLRAVGLRPINNIVDITNYVLYETGQPLHAFDLDKLIEHQSIRAPKRQFLEIIVRRAKEGEEITTIDGVKRKLGAGILVIADSNKPIAIAGVIGGSETEVGSGTKNILLESAEFSPALVRRGARKLTVSTESSYRFERKIDPRGVAVAAQRAAELIAEFAGGEVNCKCQVSSVKCQEKKVTLSIEKAQRILGVKISPVKIKQILCALGFKLARPMLLHGYPGMQHVVVSVPSFRRDISMEEDLIEEIARVYGYDKIADTLPYILPRIIDLKGLSHIPGENLSFKLKNGIKNILAGTGFYETVNYGLISKGALLGGAAALEIANPLSREQEVLRPDLFAGLLNNIAYNLNRKNGSLKLFELGNVFSCLDGENIEHWAIGLAMCGEISSGWQRPGKTNVTLYDLKGAVEELFARLKIEGLDFSPGRHPVFKAGACFSASIQGNPCGFIGEADPGALDKNSIKEKTVCLGQIDLAGLFEAQAKKILKPYSPYPTVRRDISLLIKKEAPYVEIKKVILRAGGDTLNNIKLLEQYTASPVPEGFKNLLFSLEYSSLERTLKDEEIDSLHKGIIRTLSEKLGAQIR